MGKTYGYVRVSTKDQNEARQILEMQTVPIPECSVYVDHETGKHFNRPQYTKLKRKLRKDDLLYIKSIDRLGRNYAEIQEEWRAIVKKGVDIVVMDMPLLDTRRGKDLMGTFLSDIVLQLLSFVAENELKTIRARQAEGIAAAKLRGVRFGRPVKPLPKSFKNAYRMWRRKEISLVNAAKMCGMPRSTFYYHAQLKMREEEK